MSSTRPIIVVAEPLDAAAMDKLRAVGDVRELSACDEITLLAAVADADALVVRTSSQVTQRVIHAAGKLKVIGRAGVGLDNIDLAAARNKGVAVVYTPAASTDAVADLTVGMMIALLRDFRGNDAEVRSGRFAEARRRALSADLDRLTLGIMGLGRIGQAVARRARVFGMKVIFHDIVSPGWVDFVVERVELDPLLTAADVITLHVPLTDQTRGMINESALSRMKPTGYLINTSRGAVVDCTALARSLRDGRLAGAALDVYDPEPLPNGHPLLSAPNTLLTPHLGAKTFDGQTRMNAVVDDVIRVLIGRPPQFPAES